jgi:hypothetical protein
VRGMITKSITPSIFGDAEVAGTSRSRLLELLRSSDFLTRRENQELLPLNAADRACRRPLTKMKDEETITIHRPGRSTYPEEKSVLTSGTTPEDRRRNCLKCGSFDRRGLELSDSAMLRLISSLQIPMTDRRFRDPSVAPFRPFHGSSPESHRNHAWAWGERWSGNQRRG